jgi:SNF2 family DNA or RNA helicase
MDNSSIQIMFLPFMAIAAILADEMGLGKTIQVP